MKQVPVFQNRGCHGWAIYLGVVGSLAFGALTYAQQFGSWNLNADGSWGTASNWVPSVSVPSGAGAQIHINNNISANRVLTLGADRTMGLLLLGDLSSTQTFTLNGGGGALVFDMGAAGGGAAWLNKFQGGADVINADLILNDSLNVRLTTQSLELAGGLSGAGVLTSYGNGRLKLTGDNTSSSVDLWIWNRGANTVNGNPQVTLGAATGNAIGGTVTIGNANFGGNGYAVLELAQGRSNQDQIADSSSLIFGGLSGRWAYFKLMGGDETVARIVDTGAGAVIENMESETVDTDAVLTINGSLDSYISGHLRDRAGGSGLGTLGLVKAGTGDLMLSGGNIRYTGDTTVTAGRLNLIDTTNFASALNVGPSGTLRLTRTPNSNLNFDDVIIGGGTVEINALGGNASAITLQSTGNNIGTLRVMQGGFAVSTGGNTFGEIQVGGDEVTQNFDLTLSGSNSISGSLSVTGDFGGSLSQVTVSGNNPIAGNVSLTHATMRLQAGGQIGSPGSITIAGRAGVSGEFVFDNGSVSNANRVGDTTDFISNGGTLTFIGGSGTNETLASLQLVQGELRVGSSGTGVLTFDAGAGRQPGTTLNVTRTDIGAAGKVIFSVAPVLDDGIISGGWATVGSEWATHGAGGITAFSGYVVDQAPATWLASSNVKIDTVNPAALAADTVINSLNMTTTNTQNRVLNLGSATRILTLDSGGIISSARNHSINNGILTSGTSELVVNVMSNQLTVNSQISGAGMSLTKGGAGLLILTNSNGFDGRTYINNGTVRISMESNLGTTPGSFVADQLQINGGALQIASTMTLSANRGVMIGAAGGRIEVGTNNSNVFNVTIPKISAVGVLELAVRADQGLGTSSSLTLGTVGGSNVYSGGLKTDLYQGNILVLGNNTVGPIYVEAGQLTFQGDNTFDGDIRMVAGNLILDGTNTLSGEVTVAEGELRLLSAGALGTDGFSLNLGNGKLSLNDTTQVVSAITSTTKAEIVNDGVAAAVLAFANDTDQLVNANISDGAGVGALGITKSGIGTVRLLNVDNSFTGPVRIESGVLAVNSFGYAGSNSALGQASSYDPEFLVLNGGGLRFDLAVPWVTDRSFTLGVGADAGALIAAGSNREATISLGQDFPDFFYSTPSVAFEGAGPRTLTLGGYNAGYNLFNVPLGDENVVTGQTSLQKIGAGIWEIGIANAYSGQTVVQEGTLAVSANEALGAAGGSGTMLLGGRLELRNVNYSTAEALDFEGGQLTAQIGQSTWAGDWNVHANSTLNLALDTKITLTGNLTGNRGITQLGEGTVALAGEADAQTSGGWDNGNRFYSVNAGTLILDYTSNGNSKLADEARLTLGGSRRGGTLRLVGGSHEEVVVATTIAAGENAIYRDSGTSVIRLNTISRQPGATLYFDEPNIAKVDNGNVNGILGAWAIVRDPVQGDLDWAKNATGGADGFVVASSIYLSNNFATNANTSAISSFTKGINITGYTLRFNGPNVGTTSADIEVTLDGALNQLQTGGILVTPKMGSFDSIISGTGALYTGNAQQVPDFLINQFNPDGNLIIESQIIDRPDSVSNVAGTLSSSNNRRIDGLDASQVATLAVGTEVVGPGIPAGATITGFFSGTSIQISTAHVADGSSVTPTFDYHGGLEKLGPGDLILTNSNLYTGTTTIANGVLTATVIADGGVASSLGASSNAASNLVFNGGALRYVGDNASTDRGFTINEFARFEVGHEAASLTMTGTTSGTERMEVGGPGTLVLTGSSTGVTHWYLDEGAVELQLNTANNRFANSLADLTLAGGTLRVVGDPLADRTQQFGGQLTIGSGSSEVRAISALGGIAGRSTTVQLGGVDEITPVLRAAGGTVRFVEAPVAGGGAANITLTLAVLDRATILPYATYQNTADLSQPGVNNFAATDTTTNGIVSADFLSLHDIGSIYLNPNPDPINGGGWTSGDTNPSEGASGAFSGVLTADRTVGTLRYFQPEDGTVEIPLGLNLNINKGGVMVGANVGDITKAIIGAGTIRGGLANSEGTRDLIWHNYNRATSFLIGAVIGDFTKTVENDGSTTTGSTSLFVGFGSATVIPALEVGMAVEGPGIEPGTVISAIRPDLFLVELSKPASSDTFSESFVFSSSANFIQTGVGTTVVAGTNTYTGSTFVTGGVMRLDSAGAVPGGIGAAGGTSHLAIDGGVVGLGFEDFSRSLGTGADQVEIRSSGGFAAYGANRQINFGGANEQIVWGRGGFVPMSSSLIFGAYDSTHSAILTNPLDLGFGSQVVRAENGFGVVDGELAGAISGQAMLIKRGYGALRLSGANTFDGGVAIEAGTLIGAAGGNVFGNPAGLIRLGATSFTDIDGQLTLELEGGLVANSLEVGALNATGTSMIRFSGTAELSGAVSLSRDLFVAPMGASVEGSLSGALTGPGGITVLSGGSVVLTNSSNDFGTAGGGAGDAIDGGSVVRSGTLVVGATGALGTTTVELGDALPQVITVDRATSGLEMTLKGGSFNPVHNGIFSGSGAGAFLEVADTIDGRIFSRADAGALVLVKDDLAFPERNGVYQVIFYDLPAGGGDDPQPLGTMNLVRVAALDEPAELAYGTRIDVQNGTANAGSSFFIAGDIAAVNETAVNFLPDMAAPQVSLQVSAAGVEVTNPVDVNATNPAAQPSIGGADSLTAGTATFSGPVVLRDLQAGVQETTSLQLMSNTSDDLGIVFAGVFQEAAGGGTGVDDLLALMKVGNGRATLTAANSYGGGTTVSEGMLIVNNVTGSGTGSGAVLVEASAILAGTGVIAGPTTASGSPGSPAMISPGDPSAIGGIGTLTFQQSLDLAADSQLSFGLLANGVNDLVVTDSLIVDASTIFKVLLDASYTPMAGDLFDLMDWNSLGVGSDIDWEAQLDLPSVPQGWDTSRFNSDGVIQVVPEPSRTVCLGIGFALVVFRRRRRN
ncbi:MAG: autotransporter-associated beta strand repeat-containing protein [Verrucomicrobiaceae bacterium]|nr:autotransporter-associated beta strand repeat-containing protein [Verrucomicrobiaceae bacterium]